MALPRQKKKNRSSKPKIRQSNRLKRPINPMGNSIIAQNWNKKETLSQNYRRMGLIAKLGKTAGGVEKSATAASSTQTPFAVKASATVPAGAIQEARLERDAAGKVVRVVHLTTNPLQDLLAQFDEDEAYQQQQRADEEGAEEEWGGIEDDDDDESRPAVIRAIEKQASRPVEAAVRHQSAGEREWLEKLVARHGDNTEAMAWDKKLNPMQQTAADIRRRLKKAGMLKA